MHDALAARIAALPLVGAVSLIDTSGRLVNFSRYWPIPAVNVADRNYFQALTHDPRLERFISRPVTNRGDSTRTVFMACKITEPDCTVLGLVLAALDLRNFERLYAWWRQAPATPSRCSATTAR